MRVKKWKNPGTSKNSEYHKFYQSWRNMTNRIRYKKSYSDVSICERWQSYDNFFDDMISTWKPGLVLDKDIIKPGNRVYCKEYCQWVSQTVNLKDTHKRHPEIAKNINGENHPMKRKEISDKLKGNTYNAKKVRCKETGEIFISGFEAERKYNLTKNSVSNAANPNDKTHTKAGGYHWEYVG